MENTSLELQSGVLANINIIWGFEKNFKPVLCAFISAKAKIAAAAISPNSNPNPNLASS